MNCVTFRQNSIEMRRNQIMSLKAKPAWWIKVATASVLLCAVDIVRSRKIVSQSYPNNTVDTSTDNHPVK